MELPEQDRQAFIDAARRRTQPQEGGAAFKYPSSGKRPEKLNVSRDVNMPAQMARGWAAGTLGLPGDIEALGRMGINFAFGPGGVNVDETPVLPTSEFYQEYLPGGDERPAAKFASGLGALTGGMGSTTLVRGAGKGAKAVGKALGPKAAEMAEGYLQSSGLAPSVIKPKGGNWLSGSVERATEPLRSQAASGRPEEALAQMREMYTPQTTTPEVMQMVEGPFRHLEGEVALNNWIDTKLNKYIKNEMATPEDPVRALAERGVLHIEPRRGRDTVSSQVVKQQRTEAGYPKEGLAKSDLAKGWETESDLAINRLTAGRMLDVGDAPTEGRLETLRANPWLSKVAPETPVYESDPFRQAGFDHLIDELRNATRADSDLPANLRWKPEDLKKVTVPQAVERVAKINEWRAAQKAEADAAKARNPATFTFKEYPEKGMQWVELKSPEGGELPEGARRKQMSATQGGIDVPGVGFVEAKYDPKTGLDWERAEKDAKKLMGRKPLEEALKYEGETMGHCVGGYCPDVLEGRSRIYSLRDKKGEPHVTIEVQPFPKHDNDFVFYELQDKLGRAPTQTEWDEAMAAKPPVIVQIKGKGNRAPKEEYLPMVQDFVRSGNWSRVGDLHNTQLIAVDPGSELANALQTAGKKVPQYVTQDELTKLLAWKRGEGDVPQGYARGGLVQDTDAIAAKLKATGMDDQKAFMQALRMADARLTARP